MAGRALWILTKYAVGHATHNFTVIQMLTTITTTNSRQSNIIKIINFTKPKRTKKQLETKLKNYE